MNLADLPIVDGHGHPLLVDPWGVDPATFRELFTEGRPGTMMDHIHHGGYFRRAIDGLAQWLGTMPTVDAILERRRAAGPELARRALSDRRVEALLIDTGYPPTAMSLAEMRRLLPCAIHQIVRVESCAQGLLARGLPYREFLEAFRAELDRAAASCVAFKSVIAYRSGLAVREWPAADATAAYDQAVARVRAGGSSRLADKPLLDTLFMVTLEVAGRTRRPVQIHAGFGDPDIDLPLANPALLRPILEDPRWAELRLVVLHQAYPYFREAAFMTAVWPQVFLDLSLAIPYLGPGAIPALIEILSLAPSTKLCYGSDVQGLPELFGLSADWGRAALGEALDWLIERRALSAADGRAVASQILAENARALYSLPPAPGERVRRPASPSRS